MKGKIYNEKSQLKYIIKYCKMTELQMIGC